MAIPADDGVSPFFWNEDGILIERATGEPVLDRDGNPIPWREPEPDPNESLPYSGPTLWAVQAYRLDLPLETAVTMWIEAETESRARGLFAETAGYGMALVPGSPVQKWQPENLAQHLRWLAGTEGNLAAVLSRQ